MEDRYRFKFWDTKAKVFVTRGISISVNTEGELEPSCVVQSRLIAVQCTGLKDVNGVLIYDGDILDIFGAIGQVTWMDSGFVLIGEGYDGCNLFPQIRSVDGGNAMWGKVIGNKFENSSKGAQDAVRHM